MNELFNLPPIAWDQGEQLWIGFRLATLSQQSAIPYGLLENHLMITGQGKILLIQPNTVESLTAIQQRFTGEVIQGDNRLLTPGLIDCHTHLVFGGNRVSEWERRLQGESYQSIAAAGGGILSTVKATRTASEQELFDGAAERLSVMRSEGVTTLEIKSGYGLELETELKMLRVARRLAEEFPVDIETTLLAAHALPPEYGDHRERYIDWVCQEMIPAAQSLCSAVDVFCEKIAFSVDQSRRVLTAGRKAGLQLKIHAEQLSRLGGAVMAAELGALSVDHIEYLAEEDCRRIAQLAELAELAQLAQLAQLAELAELAETASQRAGCDDAQPGGISPPSAQVQPSITVATLLPGAFYFLKETQLPPTQSLIANKIPIAVATDFNPGSSPLLSLRMAGNMACQLFGLTPEQALLGVTRHAAAALGMLNTRGTLEVGKNADFVVWKADSPAEIFYTLGGNPCEAVYRRGIRC